MLRIGVRQLRQPQPHALPCSAPPRRLGLSVRALTRHATRLSAFITPSHGLAYARKPSHKPGGGPSNTPAPQQPQTPAPRPPPSSRSSSGGSPPPGFWAKVEFFKEYFIGGLALLAVLVAVLWWAAERVPETNRLRIMFYPRWMDQRLGEAAERSLALTNKLVDSTHADDVKLLQGIADRLAKTPGGFKMRVSVAEQRAPNAFVLPNGRCVVTTSLLDLLGRDPDMLAVVLAHESAHVRARHSAERMSNATLVSFLLGNTSHSTAAALLLELPFSRRQEEEADFIGLLSVARACYAPQKAVEVWQRMSTLDSSRLGNALSLLSTHPSSKDRLQKLAEWQARAEQERLAYCNSDGTRKRKAKKVK